MATKIVPTLRYADAPAAIDWLCRAFGFEKRLVVPGEGGRIAHAQLTFAGAMVMLGSAGRGGYDDMIVQPAQAGGETQAPYVIVEDVDAHCDRARAAGAEIVIEPGRPGPWRPLLCVPRSREASVELRLLRPLGGRRGDVGSGAPAGGYAIGF